MVYLLIAFGHDALDAHDGVEGVERASREKPDLILLDIHMPRMDGYEVARHLRETPECMRIPIVAVTALAMVGDRERILASGFTGYIAKPVEPETFAAQVQAFLAAGLQDNPRPPARAPQGEIQVKREGRGSAIRRQHADEYRSRTDRGLLVSRFWYLRPVDPRTLLITGLTRDGVWYIEKGKIQYAVRNFRFNQSVLEMLSPGNVDLIGAPERVGSSESQGSSSALLPALKVKQFHFTSQSEAV